MGNRAAQIRAQNAGLVVTRRGRRFIEFDLGGGKQRFVTTIEPLHYGAANDSEIDTAWQADIGAWQYKLLTNTFQLHARNVLNAGDTVQWSDPDSGQTVTLQPDLSVLRIEPGRRELQVYVQGGLAYAPATWPLDVRE